MKRKYGLGVLTLCLLLSACGSTRDTSAEVTNTYEVTPAPMEVDHVESASSTELSESDSVMGTGSTAENIAGTEGTMVQAEPITLKVYSQLCSWSGEQQGWFAKVMLDEFNVKLEYVWDGNEETSLDSVADIIVFGSRNQYIEAVEAGHLLDWEANDLLAEHGAYILEHMPKALEYNRSLTPQENKIFGLGHNVVPSIDVCEDFFLTWDIRWDLYKELDYPQVQDLEDLVNVFEDMKALCPTDENGEETYAMSLWPDWDSYYAMVMPVKCMATAYYGYDEHEMGMYDSETGVFYGALEENGPYLEMLKFFNTLYRKDLLDPDSKMQTYEDMLEKLGKGGIFFSIFNYAGSMAYNTETHLAENKIMASLLPEEASPAAYGLSVYGGQKNWTISASTQYPQLCMDIINWFATPEGRMTQEYGPRGMFWDYDEDRNTYFTKMGKIWMEERVIQVPEEYGGGYFNDGAPQINNVTWYYQSPNPDSNGETYDYQSWRSNIPGSSCDMEQAWRDYTGALTANEYIKSKDYVVIPEAHYEAGEKGDNLESIWKQVTECIITGSWEAIYAESEEAFDRIVSEMTAEAKKRGYEECIAWCNYEARRRDKLEDALRNVCE